MYINQKIQVKWNYMLSNKYTTLVSMYVNDLIDILRSSNNGCGNHYMGAYGLKEMLKLCEDYALKQKRYF